MSHARVLVNVGDINIADTKAIEERVSVLMDPYNEYGEWFRHVDEEKPASKFDYYCRLKEWTAATIDPDYISFAVFDPVLGWMENGTLGWFGSVANEGPREAWRQKVKDYLAGLPPTDVLVELDYHV